MRGQSVLLGWHSASMCMCAIHLLGVFYSCILLFEIGSALDEPHCKSFIAKCNLLDSSTFSKHQPLFMSFPSMLGVQKLLHSAACPLPRPSKDVTHE